MIDWSFPPELQKRYDEILEQNRRLQAQFGITPRTMEERYQDYLKRKAEEEQRQEELKKVTQRRPPPRWKV